MKTWLPKVVKRVCNLAWLKILKITPLQVHTGTTKCARVMLELPKINNLHIIVDYALKLQTA